MFPVMSRLLTSLAVVAAVLFSATCTMADTADAAETAAGDARYRVTYQATWSAATHPTNFPDNPHFSGLVGATHDESTRIWQRGELASDGIELMAETGGKTKLLKEIAALVEAGSAHGELSGGGLSTSPASVSLEFAVASSHPFVTLVSMLAPSPDWFVGVSAWSLLAEDETWKEREEVTLRLYDAGTDDGVRFTSANVDSDPPQPISRLSSASRDTDFTDGAPAVGTFLFEKLP